MAKKKDSARPGIASVLADVEKKFGRGAIRRGSEIAPIERIPSGVFSLDCAVGVYGGVAGFPQGRVSSLQGEESCAKTYIGSRLLAAFQARDEEALLVDAEGDWDPVWGEQLGINPEELMLQPSESMEQTLDILAAVIRAMPRGGIVVDSWAALTPMSEIEESMFDWQQGLGARLSNKGWRNFQAGMNTASRVFDDIGPTIVVIQQERTKFTRTGPARTVPGGAGQRFAFSVTVALWSGKPVYVVNGRLTSDRPKDWKDLDPIGHTFHFQVVKNKTAPPKRYGEFTVFSAHADLGNRLIVPGETDVEEQIIRAAVKHGIVQKSGSWYKLGDATIGQGENGAAQALYEDHDLLETLKADVIAAEEAFVGKLNRGT